MIQGGGGVRSDKLLDLSAMVLPFSLILCKATLERLAPGQILEVLVSGQDTLSDLLTILPRAGDHILAWEAQGEHFRLWVQKGSPQL